MRIKSYWLNSVGKKDKTKPIAPLPTLLKKLMTFAAAMTISRSTVN